MISLGCLISQAAASGRRRAPCVSDGSPYGGIMWKHALSPGPLLRTGLRHRARTLRRSSAVARSQGRSGGLSRMPRDCCVALRSIMLRARAIGRRRVATWGHKTVVIVVSRHVPLCSAAAAGTQYRTPHRRHSIAAPKNPASQLPSQQRAERCTSPHNNPVASCSGRKREGASAATRLCISRHDSVSNTDHV